MIPKSTIVRFGEHAITNASIDEECVMDLARISPINVLYSDPPWGDGNLKYWATMNEKMTGDKFAPLTYEQLMTRLDELIKFVHGYVFIETGLRWTDQFLEHFGYLHNVEIIEMKYRSGSKIMTNPCLFGGTAPLFKYGHGPLKNLFDAASVKEIIGNVAEPGDVVLDPCCGMGYTAQACVDLGLTFRGNEFNAKRLQKTIARLGG